MAANPANPPACLRQPRPSLQPSPLTFGGLQRLGEQPSAPGPPPATAQLHLAAGGVSGHIRHAVALAKMTRYREVNRERLTVKAAQVRAKPEEKLRNVQRTKLWAKENPAERRAQHANRRAQKIRAMPVWVDRQEIANVYRGARSLSKRLGVVFHVDHIVPLRSNLVCGLHVPANLQVLSGELNMAKSNCYWPDMP